MEPITAHEYWAQVRSLAKQITEEAREYDRDIFDVLHETIDGHQWVIYTYHNFGVLLHCSDHDAYSDEFGEPPVLDGGGLNWAALAYAALALDVREHSDFDA